MFKIIIIFEIIVLLTFAYSFYRSHDVPDSVKITTYKHITNDSFQVTKEEKVEFTVEDAAKVQTYKSQVEAFPVYHKKYKPIWEQFFGLSMTCLGAMAWINSDDYRVTFYKNGEIVKDADVRIGCKGGTSIGLIDYRDTPWEFLEEIEKVNK